MDSSSKFVACRKASAGRIRRPVLVDLRIITQLSIAPVADLPHPAASR
jgi:hypothetical protein